ncbi:YkgJ family cysteine cluster protein [Pseudodesulfovibrio cashew]|uniref:YkgJ family cysteine cluster protein n=1 Tax=Pseudodesulfovibrio cashew TaxID=2678688 RepID=A0A6I6JGR7_9BACT|nr:YkgJ family cysteine cluster protein [Pseudodesulfovibrio cashew]QGY39257.1 YkgJ family cysteine cluster protein [Pseudodesulfovibrio cashew]
MSEDQTKDFLDSLPELEEGKTYCFKCYPGIECFNACCSDLNMTLTPYDILRMRQATGKDSIDFLRVHTIGQRAPDTNFPVFKLRMTDNAARTCPFVTEEGCAIYPDRPGACRMYPLGRATRPDGKGGVKEQFFIVKEDHCKGFLEKDEWTGASWKQDQGFHEYTASNDRYMHILARIKEGGHPVSDKMSHMATLALYKVDEFQRFIEKMRLFERVDVDEKRQRAILNDEFVCLSFAMDWFELMLFHDTTKLKPKNVPTRTPCQK